MSPLAIPQGELETRMPQDFRRTLALILAGGVGSRLNVLVQRRAKPAVPFGGIYRIIDFSISNVMNSGLERVGFLTQYLPYSLTEHIGHGQPWGMVGRSREVKILPPHQGIHGSDWYKGTADAIFRNLSYVERHDPDQVLILSGDHVYSMDYAALISHHIRVGADATIAVRTVPLEEASAFGTIHTDNDGWITQFEEKPPEPTSNLISMGIYVFSTNILTRTLRELTGAGKGADFGHHIFPSLLASGAKLSTYLWNGYWQDVGTIKAYFDAQMDMVDPESPLDLGAWGIRTNLEEHRLADRPAAYVSKTGSIRQSIMSRGCRIDGTVRGSVLSPGVVVEEGATIENSVILNGCRIKSGAVLRQMILDKDVEIGREAQLGGTGEDRVNERFPTHLDSGISLIGKGAKIAPKTVLERNAVIFPGIDLRESAVTQIKSGETVDRRVETHAEDGS